MEPKIEDAKVLEVPVFEKIVSNNNVFFTVKSVDRGQYQISAIDELTEYTYGPEPIYDKFNQNTVSKFLDVPPEVIEIGESQLVIKVEQYDDPITLKIAKKDPDALLTLLKKRVKFLEKERRKQQVHTGQTKPTDWKVYTSEGLVVKVDISHLELKNPPIVITSIGGVLNHWSLVGGSAVYNVTANNFSVFIQWSQGGPLTTSQAVKYGWFLNYAVFNQDCQD